MPFKTRSPETLTKATAAWQKPRFESVPYLDCCERQQRAAWRDYRRKLKELQARTLSCLQTRLLSEVVSSSMSFGSVATVEEL